MGLEHPTIIRIYMALSPRHFSPSRQSPLCPRHPINKEEGFDGLASGTLRVLSAAKGGRPIKDESDRAVNVCPQGRFRVGIVGSVGDMH